MTPNSPLRRWGPCLAIAILAIIFYLPSLQGVYIWDDEPWLTTNTTVQSPSGLSQIWFDVDANPQYYPLVFTTFWIEYRLWGLGKLGPDNFLHAPGYHIDNILLHMITCLILFHILKKLKLPGGELGAWLAAAIFAVHPVNVESVAWVAERKNVLCGVFFFSSLLYGLKLFRVVDDDAPTLQKPIHHAHFSLALFLFVLAMFSKTTACVLPPALLLMIWWRRGRITLKEVLLSTPFFIIAAGMGLITVHTEHGDTVGAHGIEFTFSPLARFVLQHPEQATVPMRIGAMFQEFLARTLIAGQDLWFYVGKLFWPYPVMQIYPRFSYDIFNPVLYIAPITFLLLIAVLFAFRRRITRGPLVAILFFAGTLFPALGYIRFYTMINTFVADHYQYFSCIAIIVLAVETLLWALRKASAIFPTDDPEQGTSRFFNLAATLIAAGLILCLGTFSLGVSSLYQNAEALWRFNTDMNPNAHAAWRSLANAVLQRAASTPQERADAEAEAKVDLQNSIRLAPNDWLGYQDLGMVYLHENMIEQARAYLNKGEELEPPSLKKRAMDLLARQTTLSVDVNNSDLTSQTGQSVDFLLGQNYERRGMTDEAIAAYKRDLEKNPQNSADFTELAACYVMKNELTETEKWSRKAIGTRPNDAPAWFYLAMAIHFTHPDEGQEALYKARKLDPAILLHLPSGIMNILSSLQPKPATAP